MKFNLLPKTSHFFLLLEQLAVKASETSKIFQEMILSWETSRSKVQDIRRLEHECDLIVHEIMVRLNKTFITPIDREDIHGLTKKIDDLVDLFQALSERLLIFKIEEFSDTFKKMTAILESATHHVVALVQRLKALKASHELFELCIEIHNLENQGDRLFEHSLEELFQNPSDPFEVIKWKEIYDFLEKAIDKCEDIADILWGIAVKYG